MLIFGSVVSLTAVYFVCQHAISAMCERCLELDTKIERYNRIAGSITDQLAIERIKKLVNELAAEKAALHPGQAMPRATDP